MVVMVVVMVVVGVVMMAFVCITISCGREGHLPILAST